MLGSLDQGLQKKEDACFNCGEVGHFSKEWPKKQRQGQRAGSLEGRYMLSRLVDQIEGGKFMLKV